MRIKTIIEKLFHKKKLKIIIKKTKKYKFKIININLMFCSLKSEFSQQLSYKKYSCKTIKNIDNFLIKIACNTTEFSCKNLDFSLLKNAGINEKIPIYVFDKKQEKLSELIKVFNVIKKSKKFQIIFVTENTSEEKYLQKKLKNCAFCYHIINKENINFYLLEQIKKLDVNYQNKRYFSVQKNCDFGVNINDIEFYEERVKSGYFTRTYADKNVQVLIKEFLFEKMPSYYVEIQNFTLKTIEKIITLKKYSKAGICSLRDISNNIEIFNFEEEKFYLNSSLKPKSFCKYFNEFFVLYKVKLKQKESKSFVFIFSKNNLKIKNENSLKLKLFFESVSNFNNKFLVRIVHQNKDFENLFNVVLPKKILSQSLNEIDILTEEFYFNNLEEILQVSKQKINFESLYNHILKNVLGIKIFEDKLQFLTCHEMLGNEFLVKVKNDGKESLFHFVKNKSSGYFVIHNGIEFVNCHNFNLKCEGHNILL